MPTIVTIQSDIKAVLAGVADFSGLELMLELDEAATPDQLAAQDAVFEREISRKGFVVVITYPRASVISAAKLPGALHLRAVCQVGLIENPTINRLTAPDATRPELAPAGKKPLVLLRAAIAALLKAGFEFPDAPIASPEIDLEGNNLHGLLVTAKDDVRAAP